MTKTSPTRSKSAKNTRPPKETFRRIHSHKTAVSTSQTLLYTSVYEYESRPISPVVVLALSLCRAHHRLDEAERSAPG